MSSISSTSSSWLIRSGHIPRRISAAHDGTCPEYQRRLARRVLGFDGLGDHQDGDIAGIGTGWVQHGPTGTAERGGDRGASGPRSAGDTDRDGPGQAPQDRSQAGIAGPCGESRQLLGENDRLLTSCVALTPIPTSNGDTAARWW